MRFAGSLGKQCIHVRTVLPDTIRALSFLLVCRAFIQIIWPKIFASGLSKTTRQEQVYARRTSICIPRTKRTYASPDLPKTIRFPTWDRVPTQPDADSRELAKQTKTCTCWNRRCGIFCIYSLIRLFEERSEIKTYERPSIPAHTNHKKTACTWTTRKCE